MRIFYLSLLYAMIICLLCGCSKRRDTGNNQGQGILHIMIENDYHVPVYNDKQITKSTNASDMTLEILKGSTTVASYSPVGSSNKILTLDQGNYTINAYSEIFTTPKFENPVYGAKKDIVINTGRETDETLTCYQTNAGVNITYGDSFKSQYTTYSTLASHTTGSLNFAGADAGRTGYFPAGTLTLTTIADGKSFNSEVILKPQRLYNVKIDQVAPSISGNLNLKLIISVLVITEDISINLPSNDSGSGGGGGGAQDIYYENIGTSAVSSPIDITAFNNWLNSTTTNTGSSARIRSEEASSGYTGASGGNYILLTSLGSNVSFSGINTSGYNSLKLTFGSSSSNTFDASNLTITATDGNNSYALTYTRNTGNAWAIATIENGIPACTNLKLIFTTENVGGYKIDDIKLTGEK